MSDDEDDGVTYREPQVNSTGLVGFKDHHSSHQPPPRNVLCAPGVAAPTDDGGVASGHAQRRRRRPLHTHQALSAVDAVLPVLPPEVDDMPASSPAESTKPKPPAIPVEPKTDPPRGATAQQKPKSAPAPVRAPL